MGKGIFYAVSVGAGDPLDMTLRAKQVLEQADVVVESMPLTMKSISAPSIVPRMRFSRFM